MYVERFNSQRYYRYKFNRRVQNTFSDMYYSMEKYPELAAQPIIFAQKVGGQWNNMTPADAKLTCIKRVKSLQDGWLKFYKNLRVEVKGHHRSTRYTLYQDYDGKFVISIPYNATVARKSDTSKSYQMNLTICQSNVALRMYV